MIGDTGRPGLILALRLVMVVVLYDKPDANVVVGGKGQRNEAA